MTPDRALPQGDRKRVEVDAGELAGEIVQHNLAFWTQG